MSISAKKAKTKTIAKRPRNKSDLAERYEEIGIKAVAAAVRFGNNKNSRQTRKEARPNRIRGMGRGE